MLKIDVVAALGAVKREVKNVERDGKPAKLIVASRVYDTDLEDAWDALTTRDRIQRWFLPIEGELKLGGRYQFQGNAGGTITTCEAPKHLAVTWENMGQVSWVDVRLASEAKNKTRLTLEHTAHVPPEFWDKYGPGAVGVGWEGGLVGLQLHFADKSATPSAEGEAWAMSDEGKRFNTLSSEEWGKAWLASGADAAQVRAGVVETTKFYTGG